MCIIHFTEKTIFIVFLTCFLLCGIFSFNSYFNFCEKSIGQIRIVDKREYYIIGKCKGRNIFLKGNTKELEEGEKIKVQGKFQKDIIYEKGIVGTYYIKQYESLKKDFIYRCYELKSAIKKELYKYLEEDKVALVMSLCFGDTSLLSKEDKNVFTKLGVIHAVSVSGFHIALIYKVVECIAGLKLALLLSLFYVIFTGLKYSAIRAFIMIVILKLSKIVYKNYDGLSSLALAFMVILLFKPYAFMEIGFMLSFLSTLGIMLYNTRIKRVLYVLPSKLNESLSITLSAQIFTLPYIAFTLQNFSLGFILGNLFLVPIYGAIVVIGNLALLFIKIPFIFKLISFVLKNLCIAVQGGIYVLLKFCPKMTYLGVREGICLTIIYFSYVMIKHGKHKFKYLPIMAVITLILSYFTIFPEIYLINNTGINAAIIKYNTHCLMICNYDLEKGREVINIKEQFNPDKIVTNVNNDFKIKINKIVIELFNDGKKIDTLSIKKHKDKLIYYDIIDMKERAYYKIMFDKVYKRR
ncbi:ComEC/Rec2 family competence protein [Clostridium lundense]|uniref:ComEC/Rec2 family competence protein n=1 Tax=Clostridium lundense TaxID=319475 RepID=UPI00146FC601|nr:ComEC/Rec2 family competence protein [Clostridium lundense]